MYLVLKALKVLRNMLTTAPRNSRPPRKLTAAPRTNKLCRRLQETQGLLSSTVELLLQRVTRCRLWAVMACSFQTPLFQVRHKKLRTCLVTVVTLKEHLEEHQIAKWQFS